jgi:hypothetical protein
LKNQERKERCNNPAEGHNRTKHHGDALPMPVEIELMELNTNGETLNADDNVRDLL